MKPSMNLPQTSIERLDEIGFQWQAKDYDETFEIHYFELDELKEDFGHCNVPQCIDNQSLGTTSIHKCHHWVTRENQALVVNCCEYAIGFDSVVPF